MPFPRPTPRSVFFATARLDAEGTGVKARIVRRRGLENLCRGRTWPALLEKEGTARSFLARWERRVSSFSPRLSALRTECFYALYLDAKGGVLLEKVISQGTLTSSLVHPREVFSPTILCRAAAVVVAHNHPSGDPEPSAEDRSTTRRLQRARRLLGIELLDHVVVGQGQYQSFLEQGWI